MAASSFEHADEARAALHAIVADPAHGADALSSSQTMANLLQDLLPDAPRETGLLVAAASAGVPAMLREHVAQGMDAGTAISLAVASFASSTAFTPEACQWAATELAIALGLAGADEAPRRDAPEIQTVISYEPAPQHQDPPTTGAVPDGQQGPDTTLTQPFGAGPADRLPARPGKTRRGVLVMLSLAAVAVAVAIAYGLTGLTSDHGSTPTSSSPATGGRGNAWIAQLASVPFSEGVARLDSMLASVRLEVPNAQVLNSSDYASLNPGFWVVYYAGSFTDGTQALGYCAAHGRTTPNQCIGRFLSHSAADHRYQCYPPLTSPSATCFHPAGLTPSALVEAYLAAINERDWPQVWQLGGKNLGQSYRQMIAGYRQTSKIVVTSITTSGDNVSVRVLANETTGAVQTYALSYRVSGIVILWGKSTLLGTQ